ncbi:hypothetical protein ElyMa_004396600 [Elysia marginata]|uniref:Uncharacterized protein n=1 Tax=Elysia marginata TaxID=1093978 RepID=A0AAV4H9S9_9GAST|nr:hypothetical protein ElyMa_004396600 [Elysia marginata]
MATSVEGLSLGLSIFVSLIVLVYTGLPVPKYFQGDWFSMESGRSVETKISPDKWAGNYEILEIHNHPVFTTEGRNHTMLLKNTESTSNCFVCLDVLWRTTNILQFKRSSCLTARTKDWKEMCPGAKSLPSQDQLITMFRLTLEIVNCISTWEGVYQFSYEVNWGGGGICNNQNSLLKACQDPGSSYQDNHIFFMTYSRCPGVQSSRSETIRYQCMGSWFAVIGGKGYTFAAVADTVEKDPREKFKCLITLKNQKQEDNSIHWGLSRFADCSKLNTLYDSPVRLVLRRVPPQTPYISPQCNLPRNVSGVWFTQGIQFKSEVVVNDTHIHYLTQKSEFIFEDTYLSCQQTLGTRYLMTKYIVGKCEVDFVCYDILPRHHGIVRYRVGKPSHLTEDELADPNFMTKKFREACSWQSFTFNRNDTDWKYDVLILNPPSPVVCPIGGRYNFMQNGNGELEYYRTRIRGVTIRPRTQINCRVTVSEFKSCSQDRSKIEVDEEYCETVDYRGRPIGEYEEPDHVLTCVGFWMEDMRSYLITYDEEDAISKFRCWRFDPGLNPYMKPMVIYVLSGVGRITASQVMALLNTLLVVFISYIWL